MQKPDELNSNLKLMPALTDTLIRVGIIAVLIYLCAQVFAPFLGLMLWALILAIALYPLHLKLTGKLGGKPGRAATLIVVLGLLLIGGPTVMLGESFASHLHKVYTNYESGNIHIGAPDQKVREWPLVGEKIYKSWSSASENLPAFIEASRPQLKAISAKVLGIATSTAGGVLAFLASLIIAGIIMAYGASGDIAMREIYMRFAGPERGARLQTLSIATVRSVATGVIGVAFIQALLLGLGFTFAGIPGAGVLALLVMVLGIVQLPAIVVSLPAIAYLWMGGDASTTSNVIFTIYLLVAGMADNVLKPILLGRGVDVPMPIILLGALGGMATSGIIGLFIGAILLAVGYQIFMEWVAEPVSDQQDAHSEPASEQ